MKKLLKNSKYKFALALIFLIAIVIRFLYFPDNIYFGFDQARDAYESQGIYKNFDLKIVGPPTSSSELFHGPLYWYLVGPIYLLGGGNPAFPAGFIRIYNAMGVFLIFWIGKTLFNSRVGIFAALLYAFSFEQTQYAIYFHHPPLAVLTIMIFYAGLALAVFKKNWLGIPLSLFGYGLSIQAEFQLPYLGIIFVFLFLSFRKQLLPLLCPRTLLISAFFFLAPVSSFILAELKYKGRSIHEIFRLLAHAGDGSSDLGVSISAYCKWLVLLIRNNIINSDVLAPIVLFTLLFAGVIYILRKKSDYQKIYFLITWLLSTSVLSLFGPTPLYYTHVGISVAILLIASFVIEIISKKIKWAAAALLVVVILSNLSIVKEQNYQGVIGEMQVQKGMLLGREKQIVDYIYQQSEGLPVVVSASTMPLQVNTTWAYLFNWYGMSKYGRVPYWAGPVAQGYPGELPTWKSQKQKYAAFSIIEPVRGVRGAFIEQFLKEQDQYGEFVDQIKLGDEKTQSQIIVQKRVHN